MELWGKAKELVKGNVVTKVVDKMWTYLFKNVRAFYKWIFTCYVYTKLGWEFIWSTLWAIGMRLLSARLKSVR